MAQLMAELDTALKFRPQLKAPTKRGYPVRPRPTHLLNEVQTAALRLLQAYSPLLKDNFNFSELKAAHRAAVLKTHPDQGGTSESFQEARKSYQMLLALVKKQA